MKRFTAFSLALLLAMACCAQCVGAAEADPYQSSHSYQFVIGDCSWAEAFQYAKDAGGYLAHFETVEEFDNVVEMIEQQGLTWKIFWIGGRRDLNSSEYHWVDNDNVLQPEVLNDYSHPLYDEWMEGEPSYEDSGYAESCIDMFYYSGEGRWVLNDAPNSIVSVVPSFSGKVGYIIEYDDDRAQTPAANSLPEGTPLSDPSQILSIVPDSFYFSSGVGGWGTEMELYDDGSFTGDYHDSNMGEDMETYPGGTTYVSEFFGNFTNFRKIDDFTYSMELASLDYTQQPGYDYTDGTVHYIVSDAYGLAGGNLFYLYLPGHPMDTLPEEFLSWTRMYMGYDDDAANLTIYGLYNVAAEAGWGGNW